MRRRVARTLCALVFLFGGVPEAAARPGGGYTLGADATATSTARPASRPVSRRSTGRDAGARSAAVEVEPWSSRPRYAAPWSAPKPETHRPGGRGTPATSGPRGSFASYYFWIFAAVSALAVVAWLYTLIRRKEQIPWDSRGPSEKRAMA